MYLQNSPINHTLAPALHQRHFELKLAIIPKLVHYTIKPPFQEGTVLIPFQSTLSLL